MTSTAHDQSGSTVLLMARVTLNGAYECKWSSNVPTHDLPVFRRCRRGETLRRTVNVPVNTTAHARRVVYLLSEYDMLSVFPKVVTVRRIVQPALSATPVATSTTLTSTPPGAAGQTVTLSATVAPKPTGGTISFLSTSAGATESPIPGCASVAVDATTGGASCPYQLSAGVDVRAYYSGSTKGLGASWAPSWSTELSLAPAAN